jgi:hypothetical protein
MEVLVDFGLPACLTWYKLLTDWGSFVGGCFALIAGTAAYIGARQAADRQIAALTRKDRMQARGIVVGVYPELLEAREEHKRVTEAVNQRFPTMGWMTIVQAVKSAQMEVPPFLHRSVDNLFVVEPGAASLTQFFSFTLQYNRLIRDFAQRVAQSPGITDPPDMRHELAGNLKAIAIALEDAIREIRPIHDEATGP